MYEQLQKQKDEEIRQFLGEGRSYVWITSHCHVSTRRIRQIKSNEPMRHQLGRPMVTDDVVRTFIYTSLIADARLSSHVLTSMVNAHFGIDISETTVRRIRLDLGFMYRPPLVIQDLTPEQCSCRYNFCQWIIAHRDQIPHVVFSDESRFSYDPDSGWCYIKRGEWRESCFRRPCKFPTTTMVFGAIGTSYRSRLVNCSGHVDSDEYLEVLKKAGVIEDCNDLYGEKNWLFMQDGAPCHTSEITMRILHERCLLLPGWPPNSPDLNPIEMLWSIMKVRINKIKLENPAKRLTRDEIFEIANSVWDALDEEMIGRLVESFIHRCEMVVSVGGKSISQYLSSHIEPDPLQTDFEPWTDEEDELIARFIETHGKRWKQLGSQLERSAVEIKHRWKMLTDIEANERLLSRLELPSIHSFDNLLNTDFLDRLPNFLQ